MKLDEPSIIQTADPIQKSLHEGLAFDRAWLQSDHRLNTTQRLGFIALSTVSGMTGAIFLRAGLGFLNDNLFFGMPFLLFALLFLYLGVRGIWRVSKDVFKKG